MKNRLYVYGSVLLLTALLLVAFAVWDPGDKTTSARNTGNAMWIGHGWFGADDWFKAYNKNRSDFVGAKMDAMIDRLRLLHVKTVYPHLCPASATGMIPAVNVAALQLFKHKCPDIKVLPWIGGATTMTVDLTDPAWMCPTRSQPG